jgi:hypothetical protein
MPKANKDSKDQDKAKEKVKPEKAKPENVKPESARAAAGKGSKKKSEAVAAPAFGDGGAPAAVTPHAAPHDMPHGAPHAASAPAAPLTAEPAAEPAPPMPVLQSPMGGRRFKPVKPPLPAGTLEISIARAKYTVRHLTGAIEVERPRKRDPKNPRVYKFTLRGCEVARKHLAGRSVTLADASELLKAVKVLELETLEGEARRQATKFLLVALSSRNEAELTRDGDLILVRVPFNAADLA